jgi:uncharacterized membrane protein YedE/YeeE
LEEIQPRILAALAGFVIGLAFGAVVQRTNFCAMGAIADVVVFRDSRRLRAWLLAGAIAILGAQGLAAAGILDLRDSIYLSSRLTWAGAVVGGLLFGLGMVLSGGCVSRNLVRLGAGDLRAFIVVLVLGVSASMTLYGLSALARVALNDATQIELSDYGLETQGLPALLGAALGIESGAWTRVFGMALALAVAAVCFASPAFRGSLRNVLAGASLGLLVVAGWWATGVLGADPFEPTGLASLSFVAPAGDGLIYLMTFTGSEIDFGIAVVGGVVLGSFAAARAGGDFRVQTFEDRGDFLRALLGAFLMGFGGVTGLGCTIGQGITGISTLALGSFLAFGSIVAGGVLGVHLLARAGD